MRDNTFNSRYTPYLSAGAAVSSTEFERRLTLVQGLQAQQAIAMQVSQANLASAQAAAQAAQSSLTAVQNARNTVADYKESSKKLLELNAISNISYLINKGAAMANITNLRTSLNNISNATSSAIYAATGEINTQYAASDILVNTGSNKDLQLQTAKTIFNEGNKQYSQRVTDIANTLLDVAATDLERKIQQETFTMQQEQTAKQISRL